MKKILSYLMVFCVLTSLLAINIPFTASAAENAFYISPNGDDKNGTGTLANPWKTAERAKEEIRAIAVAGMTSDITIYLRGGTYNVTAPITFDERDSGKNNFKVIYKNYPDEEPVFCGGSAVTGWEKYSDKIYKAKVGSDWNFNNLSENGKRSVKARYPNTGYLKVDSMVDDSPQNKFIYAQGDMPYMKDTSGLEVYMWAGGPDGVWNWDAVYDKVGNIDTTSKTITLLQDTPYEMGKGSRYFFSGSIEMIDQPGEYYVDEANGYLYYYPYNADISNSMILAPKVLQVFEFKGSSPDMRVKDIRLEGLTINMTDMEHSYSWVQNGAVYCKNAQNIEVSGCHIYNTGSTAVLIDGNSQYITVKDSLLHDLGRSGVVIKGSALIEENRTMHNTITNNLIYNAGQLTGHGTGVQIYDAAFNSITHNKIHDTSRYSISITSWESSIGKTIDGVLVTEKNLSAYASAKGNNIEFNDLSRANLDSQDTGVIENYQSGPDNLINNNLIHDSDIPFSFGSGIYLDDENYSVTVTNNILYNLQKASNKGTLNEGIFVKGVDNKIENNIIADSAARTAVTTYSMGGNNYDIDIKRNIFDSTNSVYTFGDWSDNRIRNAEDNLINDPTGNYSITKGMEAGDFSVNNIFEWKNLQDKKFDQFTKLADPMFMDKKSNDYRLKYNSPAYSLGIKDINVQDVGLTAAYPFADSNEKIGRIFVKKKGDKFNSANIELATGKKTQLQVMARTESGYVADLKNALITYQSESPQIAKIDKQGLVTAVSGGIAKITVIVSKDSIIKKQSMYILVDDSFAGMEVKLSKKTAATGESVKVKVVYKTRLGRLLDVTDTSKIQVSDNKVAELSNGFINAKAAGTTNINVSAVIAGIRRYSGTKLVVSNNILKNVALKVSKSTLRTGETAKLSVTGVMKDGKEADLKNAVIKFKVNNSDKATIKGDVLTAMKAGSVRVSVNVVLAGAEVDAISDVFIYSEGKLPTAWKKVNFGEQTTTGLAFNDGNKFTLLSNGLDFWGKNDMGTFAYSQVKNPVGTEILVVEATVDSFVNADIEGKTGIMIRESAASNAPMYNLTIGMNGCITIVYRNAWAMENHPDGDGTWYGEGPSVELPVGLRLVKQGDTVTPYYKPKGGAWTRVRPVGADDLAQKFIMPEENILGGINLFSYNTSRIALSQLSGVVVKNYLPQYKAVTASIEKSYITKGYDSVTVKLKGITTNDLLLDIDKDIIYKSSNEKVATIDENGMVRGVSPGMSEITAIYGTGINALKTALTITVINPELDSLATSAVPVFKTGETSQLVIDAKMTDGTKAVIPAWNIQYACSDTSIAKVDSNGVITAVAPGITTITTTVILNDVKRISTFNIKIPAIKPAFGEKLLAGQYDTAESGISKMGDSIGNTADGRWISFYCIDFGDVESQTLKFSFQSAAPPEFAGGIVEVRLDSPDGIKLGECTAGETMPNWDEYEVKEFHADIKGTKGVHDIYFVFRGLAENHYFNMGDFDWFEFVKN